jgi:hypothetical protein
LVFSGAEVIVRRNFEDRTQAIGSDILDGDMFDRRRHLPDSLDSHTVIGGNVRTKDKSG